MTGNGGEWLLSIRIGIRPREDPLERLEEWTEKQIQKRTIGIHAEKPILLMLAGFQTPDQRLVMISASVR